MDIRNFNLRKSGVGKTGKIGLVSIFKNKYWRGICPTCASQVRLMLAQMPKKIVDLSISILMTLLIVL